MKRGQWHAAGMCLTMRCSPDVCVCVCVDFCSTLSASPGIPSRRLPMLPVSAWQCGPGYAELTDRVKLLEFPFLQPVCSMEASPPVGSPAVLATFLSCGSTGVCARELSTTNRSTLPQHAPGPFATAWPLSGLTPQPPPPPPPSLLSPSTWHTLCFALRRAFALPRSLPLSCT